MYRIAIKDSREHGDPEFDTYEEAWIAYVKILTTCMKNGISVHLTLWKVIDGACTAQVYHCIATSAYLVHTFD